MNPLVQTLFRPLSRAILAVAVTVSLPILSQAADHGDAPALAQDQGADIADVYLFLDPTDNSRVVLIGTVHGFIAPGEAGNFAAFDNNLRYRFEIYNKHVNITPPVLPENATVAQKIAFAKAKAAYLKAVKANRTIDITFSKRAVADNPSDSKINLARPGAQTATLTLGGFTGAARRGLYNKTSTEGPIFATSPSLAAAANSQTINNIAFDTNASNDIKFFAGEVDDPFFFDVVGFSRLISSIHDGAINTTNLSRGRDTFAGYNTLAIALSIPKSLLVDVSGNNIGVDFMTQRHSAQLTGNDGFTGVGGFKNVDRMGNPAVNVALIPFNLKNNYNASSVKNDASLKFAPSIVNTITQLGLGTTDQNIALLAGIAVIRGDLLQLDTTKPNTGTNDAGFPNGRRLTDDVIDTILSVLVGSTIGDNVNANDVPLQSSFPFLALPQQPRATGVTDDNTRN